MKSKSKQGPASAAQLAIGSVAKVVCSKIKFTELPDGRVAMVAPTDMPIVLPGYQSKHPMWLEYVPIKTIEGAPHNPPGRTEQRMNQLCRSLNDVGMLQMPVVRRKTSKANKFVTVIGHRRIKGVQHTDLNPSHLWCQSTTAPPDKAFADEIIVAVKHKSNGKLFTWLTNPIAVNTAQDQRFQKAEQVIGRDGMQLLFDLGGDIHTFDSAKRAAKYGKIPTQDYADFVLSRIKWALKHQQRNELDLAIKNKTKTPLQVAWAIIQDRPLCEC